MNTNQDHRRFVPYKRTDLSWDKSVMDESGTLYSVKITDLIFISPLKVEFSLRNHFGRAFEKLNTVADHMFAGGFSVLW